MDVRIRRIAVAVAAVAGVSSALGAQKAERTTAPVGGTWGAEASIGTLSSASLIRFLSPRWALVGGASAQSTSVDNPVGGGRTTNSSISLSVGARRYGRSGLGLRPIAGFGATFTDFSSGANQQVGAYGELGAAYFSPRTSHSVQPGTPA